MKLLIKYTIVVLATLTVLLILWQFRLIVLLFVLSLFIAATIRPLVDRLTAHGLPRPVGQLLIYIFAIGGILIAIFVFGELLLLEFNSIANRSVINYEASFRGWQEGTAWQQRIAEFLPQPIGLTTAGDDTALQAMVLAIINASRGLVTVLGGSVLLLVLSVYWSADQYRFERLWLSLLPARIRPYMRDSWRQIESSVGKYMRSQLAQSMLAALLLGIGASISGYPYPIVLALIGALAAFVPFFGGLLAAMIAFALGLFESVGIGVGLAVYTLVVFLGLELIVEPRLLARGRRSFLLTLLVMIPLFQVFGLWGLLIAPPLAAALEVLIAQAYHAQSVRHSSTVDFEELEARLAQLQHRITESEDGAAAPELKNLLSRLNELIEHARGTRVA